MSVRTHKARAVRAEEAEGGPPFCYGFAVITSVADCAVSAESLTESEALRPFTASVAVMVAVPGATAVTSPLAGSTVAIVGSLDTNAGGPAGASGEPEPFGPDHS